MIRENHNRKPREWESTDAGHGGGAARSSVEGSVMGLERRGGIIPSVHEDNWKQEDRIGTDEAV